MVTQDITTLPTLELFREDEHRPWCGAENSKGPNSIGNGKERQQHGRKRWNMEWCLTTKKDKNSVLVFLDRLPSRYIHMTLFLWVLICDIFHIILIPNFHSIYHIIYIQCFLMFGILFICILIIFWLSVEIFGFNKFLSSNTRILFGQFLHFSCHFDFYIICFASYYDFGFSLFICDLS